MSKSNKGRARGERGEERGEKGKGCETGECLGGVTVACRKVVLSGWRHTSCADAGGKAA